MSDSDLNPIAAVSNDACRVRDEPLLRRQLVAAIGADFIVHSEVRGRHVFSQQSLRADLLCHPRQHLCKRGFEATWFAVETKHLDFSRDESKRLYEAAWQATTYRQSEFVVAGEAIRPGFALLFVPNEPPDYSNPVEQAQRRRWDLLMEYGVYANVGYFRLNPHDAWSIWFGQARYFDSQTGISNVPRGLKPYIGHS